MRYRYGHGVVKKDAKPKKLLFTLPLALVLVGGYVAVNMVAPKIQLPNQPNDAVAKRITSTPPKTNENRLYLPQINQDIPIHGGEATAALAQGAWLRDDSFGNPEFGGHFVLSARQFSLGITPVHTRAASPFYQIEKLAEGDEVFADYRGVRYVYKVSRVYLTERTPDAIEKSTAESQLTLYTHSDEPNGERYVVEAAPVGTVQWGKKPYIEYSTAW